MNLSFRNYYLRWSKNLFLLFGLFVLVMTVARMGFGFFFGDLKELLAKRDDLQAAMFLGLRYDLIALAYINALPFLVLNFAYTLPGKFVVRLARRLIIGILCLGYFTLIWLYVADYAFYSYYQDHINVLFFGLFEDDTAAIVLTIWKNYNVLLWLTILLLVHYGFYRFVRFLFSPYEFDLKVKRFDWKMPVIFVVGLVGLAFLARGNFTRLPLSIEDAHISSNEFINKLSINGPIALNRAIRIRRTFGQDGFDYLKKYGFSDWKEAYQIAFGKRPDSSDLIKALTSRTPAIPAVEGRPPHVVVVVMESFGSYWNEYDSETFNLLGDLREHFKNGVLFKNFQPAENGTIGSIVSVATSQVIRPGARFLSESQYMKTHLRSAGHLPFKDQGYDTNFLYGGKLGWRDLGKFLQAQGYDHLWGAEEVKEAMPELNNINAQELGNEWGIFDEYLYAFLAERLRTALRPQFFLVLTTSNHPPFEYPSSYRPLPLSLTEEIREKVTVGKELGEMRFLGLQYANHKMGQLLTNLKNSILREKVVVAITGDHSYWIAKGVGHDEEFKRYAVPFFISLPDHLKRPYDPLRFGSHEDIFPTLYNLVLSNQEYIKLGENLFEESSMAMNSKGLVANKAGAYHNNKFWKWKDLKKQILEPAEQTPELKALKRHAEAMIGLTDLYLKEEKKRMRPDEGSDQQ